MWKHAFPGKWLCAAMLVGLFLFAGLLACKKDGIEPEGGESDEYAPAANATLLYPGTDGEGDYLTALPIHLEKEGEELQDMVQLLRRYLAGPTGLDQAQPYPEGADVKALFLMEGGVLVVDLTGPVRMGGGTQIETGRVYGLINTLCWNYPSVQSVQIIVEGQEVESLLGHLSLSKPLPPNEEYLAPELRTQWRSKRGV
jgi:hypothetical protein